MREGIHLTLMIGPVVPAPVPRMVVDALKTVTVTTSTGSPSGFQLGFEFHSDSALNTLFLIAAGGNVTATTPALRVLLVVTINGTPQPLLDGVMTDVEVQPGQRDTAGTITITGEDLTRVMDAVDFSGLPYPAMPIAARVALICAKYAAFGIVPLPIPEIFVDVPIPLERTPTHQGTDLAYIRQLADEVGYVFTIDPGPTPGVNVAYFGPQLKVGIPQPALNVDMDADTNVESISLSFDPTKGVLPVVYVQNPQTRAPIPIPIPPVDPLQPPLGALPTPIANVRVMKDTAKLNPIQAISRGVAVAAESRDAVRAEGALDVLRYGRLLKARGLVGLRGVGLAYDGLYYVDAVTTELAPGSITQRFTLTRNGLMSLTPKVPA